jgi:hypothetical protein
MRFVRLLPFALSLAVVATLGALVLADVGAASTDYGVPGIRIRTVQFSGVHNVLDDVAGAAATPITGYPVCGGYPTTQWVDCDPANAAAFPSGRPIKDWPFAIARNSSLVISEATLRVTGPKVTGATVTGTALLPGGRKLTWRQGPVSENAKRDLVIRAVTSTGRLPNIVQAIEQMTINWKVTTAGGASFGAGNSSLTVYVTYDTPRSPAVYETLADFTTRAAAGARTAQQVVNRVWRVYRGRNIYQVRLNRRDGTVARPNGAGELLQYYPRGWTVLTYLDGTFFDSCPAGQLTATILRGHIGRCGGWSAFFVDSLGVQGVEAEAKTPDDFAGWGALVPAGAQLMLIKDWSFRPPTGAGFFRWVTQVEVDPGVSAHFLGRPGFSDEPGVAGQGPSADPNPPGWFAVADHALDEFGGEIYDPSYGTGPFPNITRWARRSLAGWARLACAGTPRICTLRGHRGLT